ncbi:MAG: hypothetical protein WC429_24100 [Verrucomicrobiia bacterium]
MPSKLGSIVVSSTKFQAALHRTSDVYVGPLAEPADAGGTFRDFGATAIAILGTPVALAAVKELFGLIRLAIQEAHNTRRSQDKHRLELAKMMLIMGNKHVAINLDSDLHQIEAIVADVEAEVVQQIK